MTAVPTSSPLRRRLLEALLVLVILGIVSGATLVVLDEHVQEKVISIFKQSPSANPSVEKP